MPLTVSTVSVCLKKLINISPQRKYYQLTELGKNLLRKFILRNILLFQEESVEQRVRAVLDSAS